MTDRTDELTDVAPPPDASMEATGAGAPSLKDASAEELTTTDQPTTAVQPVERPAEPAPRPRSTVDDVRLARIHLRLGMVSMARAELEDLDHREALGPREQAVLAESRWRTGDPGGAAAAAQAHLDAGGQDPVAIAITVEAAAADGRPADARRLMDRLADLDATAIDALFGGMPQRAFWPSVPGAMSMRALVDETPSAVAGSPPPAEPANASAARARALADAEAAAADEAGARTRRRFIAGQATEPPPAAATSPQPADPLAILASTSPSLWGDGRPRAEPGAVAEGSRSPSDAAEGRRVEHADPLAELARAREELARDPDRGLLRLALVLRTDPTLAPAVLDAVSVRRETAAAIIRGDAERLLGRQLEAEAAFAAAGEALERSDRPEPR